IAALPYCRAASIKQSKAPLKNYLDDAARAVLFLVMCFLAPFAGSATRQGSLIAMSSVRAITTGPNRLPALAEVAAPSARGKFIFVGDDKLYVRGVTYGTFRPDADGHEYPAAAIVERDFAHMSACGVNAVRVYTVPPPCLLDAPWRHGLRLVGGLP